MRLVHEIAIFQTVKSKVIISLFETVRLSVSISLRNLYNSLNSIKNQHVKSVIYVLKLLSNCHIAVIFRFCLFFFFFPKGDSFAAYFCG